MENLKISKNSLYGLKKIEEQFESLHKGLHIIAGPCSVENREMMEITAEKLSELGIEFLRGGAFKPRTSPYDFQGLGEEGLKILREAGKKFGMLTVSEVVDTRYVETMTKYVDVLQIGSRNMSNFELLKEVGRSKHPVLLKRGMCSTVEEFKFAAEYIANEGNKNITLCERGIRTFETATRNTLDIACIAILKKETKLPVMVDLSHSLGRKDILISVARSVIAMGVDGIMIEVHNDPGKALSDKFQQLSLDEFKYFMTQIAKNEV